jgi:hypothetical protein
VGTTRSDARDDDRDDVPPEPKVLTIFGMDIYLVSFLAVGGLAVLFGIYVLFFTRLPLPAYCGRGRTGGSYVCGWIYRGEPLPTIPTH